MNKLIKWTLICAIFFGFGIYGQHIKRQADAEAQEQGWPSAEIRDEALEAGYPEPDAWLALKREEYAKRSAIEQAAAEKAALEEAKKRAVEEISQPSVAEPAEVVKGEQEASEPSRGLEQLLLMLGFFALFACVWAYERWELKNHDALAERDKRMHEKELLDAELERVRELNELELEKAEQLNQTELQKEESIKLAEAEEAWQRARSEQLEADALEQQAALDRLHDDEPADVPQADSGASGHSWGKSIIGGLLGGIAAGVAQSASTEESDSYEPRGYNELPRYREIKLWSCSACGLTGEQEQPPHYCPSNSCKSHTGPWKNYSPIQTTKTYKVRVD